MSLLSAERYVAVLDPRGVLLVRRRGRGVPETVGMAECGVAQDGAAWAPAVDALAGLLARSLAGHGTLTVVLSSQFVRFRLVPWSDAIGSPDELEAYARLCFEEVYGAAVGAWALRLSPEAAGCPRLGAAIEQALLERLKTLASGAGLRLAAVQPYLMVAFNRLGDHLRHGDFTFVLVEATRSTLLVARKGRWAGVSSSAGGGSDEALSALIERESELQAAAGETLPPVYVHAPGHARCAPRPSGVSAPVLLAMEGAPAADPLLAMALGVH